MHRYLIAVGSVVLALLVRLAVAPWLFEKATYMPFFFAVAATAALGGIRPGLVATALSIALSAYFLLPPERSFWIDSPSDRLQLVFFTSMAGCICWLSGSLYNARRRVEREQGRRRTEQERFRLAADAVNGIVYEFDFATGHVERQRGLYEVVGHHPSEVPPTAAWWWEQIHPDDREGVEQRFTEAVGNSVVREYRVRHKDGRWLHVEDRAVLLRDEAGNPIKLVGCTVDVTARRQVEDELTRSRHQFERIVAATPDLLYVFDLTENRNVYTSPSVGRILGHPPERIASLGPELLPALIHPDELDGVIEGNKRFETLADDQVYDHELRIRHADGSYRWLRCRDVVFERDAGGRATRIIGTAQDVTDLKAQHEALREKEEQLRMAVRAADMIVFRWDIATDVVTRLGDIPADAPLGPRYTFEQAMASIHPDDLPAVRGRVAAALRGDGPEMYISEHRHNETPDGSWRWILVHGRFRRDDQGRPLVMYGLGLDITATKRAEQEVQRLNRELQGQVDELQTLLDILPVGVWHADKNCERIVGNAAAYEMLGMERGVNASLAAKTDRFTAAKCVVGGRELGPDELPLQRVARTGAVIKNFEHDVVFEDGQVVTALCNAAPLLDAEGRVRGVVGMYADITERKRAEALQAGQRLVLEMVATARPLADVLGATCRLIEEQEPGLLCSVLLPDEQGCRIGMAVGPSLPDGHSRGLVGLGIGPPYISSCGEVLACGEPVVVPDVQADERFAPEWRALLLAHRLRACRSIPVTGSDGTVLASFAIYRREPGDPAPASKELVVIATNLSSIAIGRWQAEREREEGQRTLSALIERCPFGIYIVDDEFRIASMNDGSLNGAFANVRPAIGRPFDEAMRVLWPEPVAADIIKTFRHTLDTGEPYFSKDFVNPRADIGQTEGYEWELHQVALPSGRRGVVCYYYDSTKLRRAEERLRFQLDLTKSITDNATTAIFMMDDKSRCTFMNPAAEQMTGFAFEEVEGGILHDFIHHHHPDGRPYPMPECPIDRALPEGGEVRDHEDLCFRKNGEPFPVMCNARVIHKGGVPVGTVIEVRDITTEKAAADELRRLMADLSEADRRKDEFLATLAHELRNPLAPLRNGLQIMKLAGGNPDAVEKSRSMMERQIGQMAHLIDDLMDLSRISRGKIVLQKTRLKLAESVQDAVDTARPLIEERGHELVVEVPPEPLYVDADRTRLAQVFGNILNNAAKYTDRKGRIRLAVRRQGGEVVVTIEDNGVGIPAHMLTHVFDMFAQVDRSLEKSQGGLGIGLNIVKKLVEMHGGSIVAESDGHGAGSRFVVRLPVVLTVTTDRLDDHNGVQKAKPARRRILVVDDNRDGATSLATMLRIMGNDTQAAHDGLEAVAVAEAFKPDVILMDIGMPRLNGYEACRRIREQPWGRNVVIVAQTGWGQEDDKRKSQEAGFDFHMVKPVDPAALEKLLSELQAGAV